MSSGQPPSASSATRPSATVATRQPLVSVIMSMRNSATTVGAAVRSVQLQTLQDWELIVIDDGSSDQSSSIVCAFDDSRIQLVREASSAGLAPRLNQAVALSRGDFIARMDADDICFPQRLARQVAQLQQDPRLDVLGCGAVVFANDASLLGELPVGLTHEAITAQPFRGFPFPHPTWCGRAAWFRNNPYDPKLMKAEDQDLLLRTFKNSKFGALETVLLGYRQNRIELTKLLLGRQAFIGSLWGYAWRSGDPLPAVEGIATHLFKSAADIVTISLGLNRLVQRNRLKPVPLAVVRQWQGLQEQLGLTEAAA
jgi:glycosyltransferase involved in cell wall biosynthesis